MFALFRGLEGDETTLAATTQLGGVSLPPLKKYNVQLRLLKNDVRIGHFSVRVSSAASEGPVSLSSAGVPLRPPRVRTAGQYQPLARRARGWRLAL